jgi:hypothetical protein
MQIQQTFLRPDKQRCPGQVHPLLFPKMVLEQEYFWAGAGLSGTPKSLP